MPYPAVGAVHGMPVEYNQQTMYVPVTVLVRVSR